MFFLLLGVDELLQPLCCSLGLLGFVPLAGQLGLLPCLLFPLPLTQIFARKEHSEGNRDGLGDPAHAA